MKSNISTPHELPLMSIDTVKVVICCSAAGTQLCTNTPGKNLNHLNTINSFNKTLSDNSTAAAIRKRNPAQRGSE